MRSVRLEAITGVFLIIESAEGNGKSLASSCCCGEVVVVDVDNDDVED